MYRSRAALFFLKSGLHPVRGGFKSLNRACVGCEMEFKSLNQACVRCEMEFKSLNRACVRREMEFKNFSGAQPWWPGLVVNHFFLITMIRVPFSGCTRSPICLPLSSNVGTKNG